MTQDQRDKQPKPIQESIKEKNRRLGEFIREIRKSKRSSITTCANLLGISRRRYAAMENGEAKMSFGEVQVLLDFLGVQYPQDIEIDDFVEKTFVTKSDEFKLLDEVSKRVSQNGGGVVHQIELQVQRGEPYAIIIRAAGSEHSNENQPEMITVMVKL